jgi:ABC-type dipeptide/oligopeptide/nickel transport system permease subunit
MTAAAEAIRPVGAARAGGGWALAWRRLRRDPFGLVSGSFIAFVLFMVFAGGPLVSLLVGHGPNTIFIYGANNLKPVPPWTWVPATTVTVESTAHVPKTLLILGSDGALGRDELLRLLYGGRVSLEVALGATALAVLIGATLGSLAAYFGGLVDAVISRFTDLVIAFPLLLFLIMLGSTSAGDTLDNITFGHVLNRGVFALVVLIGGLTWFYPARIVRAQILSLREREFVHAAAMIGASDSRILRKHLAPHLAPALASYGMIAVATNLLLEAGVSFLGAGIRLPNASWGTMLGQTFGSVANPTPYNASTFSLWPTVIPSLAIFLTVLALNHFGESLRDALDPRFVR